MRFIPVTLLAFFLPLLSISQPLVTEAGQKGLLDNVGQIIQLIDNIKELKKFKEVKRNVESFVKIISEEQLQPAYISDVRKAYDVSKVGFDKLILEIKKDILNKDEVANMARGKLTALEYSNKYLGLYNDAVDIFNNNLKKLIDDYYAKKGETKNFIAIVRTALPIFEALVNLISRRREFKPNKINAILDVLEKFFVKDYQLKSFETLYGKELPEDNTIPAPQYFESQATLNENRGAIRLYKAVISNNNLAKQAIGLEQQQNLFSTTSTFNLKDQFQVKVQGTGYIYSFAINNNGSATIIYPNALTNASGKATGEKAIGVQPLILNPFMAREDSLGTLTIPARNNNKEMFITIQADETTEESKEENIIILFSKKQITDMPAFIQLIEKGAGTAEQKLKDALETAGVTTDYGISATKNNKNFYGFESNADVIPIIIRLNKNVGR